MLACMRRHSDRAPCVREVGNWDARHQLLGALQSATSRCTFHTVLPTLPLPARSRVDTDDGQYEGEYNFDERSSHCSACGKMWCGPCQRALESLRRRKVSAVNTPGNTQQAQDLQDLKILYACPMCRAPVPPTLSEEEQFAQRWSLVHDRTPGSTHANPWSMPCLCV